MLTKLSLVESCNNANIFLGLIECKLNSLSVHLRFDLERYLINDCNGNISNVYYDFIVRNAYHF